MKSISERYFYHCFPRRHDDSESGEVKKGLAILGSIKKIGLLLVPEVIEFPVAELNRNVSESWFVSQKRCCFTELSPVNLPQHAKEFGHFVLEFKIKTLRRLGAMPVFYLPRITGPNAGLESMATALVAGIGQLEILFDRLSQLEETHKNNPNTDEQFLVKMNEARYYETLQLIKETKRLLEFLTEGLPSVKHLHAILKTISNFFYPTEDLHYTDLLGYYQQREWRILSNMAKDGESLTRRLLKEEEESLLDLDREFFNEELSFRDGKYRRVDNCRVFEQLDKKPIIQYARRIIVPEIAVAFAKEIFSESNDPPIISLESLSNLKK